MLTQVLVAVVVVIQLVKELVEYYLTVSVP